MVDIECDLQKPSIIFDTFMLLYMIYNIVAEYCI